jgi:hypothetical protein
MTVEALGYRVVKELPGGSGVSNRKRLQSNNLLSQEGQIPSEPLSSSEFAQIGHQRHPP